MRLILQLLFFLLLYLTCCTSSSHDSRQEEVLNLADSQIEVNPDSALRLLETIKISELNSKVEHARYSLLMSMALDKNYIDTTTFELLQPAIDYYLKKGNPDEKLRTYYQQGRIYQNKNERDSALDAFTKGLDYAANTTDSLVLGRIYENMAIQYHDFHDMGAYTSYFQKAADVYKELSKKDYEFDCLLNVLNGCILLSDRLRADSIVRKLKSFQSLDEHHKSNLDIYLLSWAIEFGSQEDIRNILNKNLKGLDNDGMLTLALAYNKTGDQVNAEHIVDFVRLNGMRYDTLRLEAIRVSIFKDKGQYKDALDTYWTLSHRQDSLDAIKYLEKSRSIEERYMNELRIQEERSSKTKTIGILVSGIIVLLFIIMVLFLVLRNHRNRKDLMVERAKNTELENARLLSESERLESEKKRLMLENRNFQLESDKKRLEAENMARRIEQLEHERESLSRVIESEKKLTSVIENTIKLRLKMVNSLVASYITNNTQYEQEYEKWVARLTSDANNFMDANRQAFELSHPGFIQFWEDRGLTLDEINYICLYALGLKGREIGNYLQKPSHINLSSAIRKKLGLSIHQTNLGNYVREVLDRF